MELASSISNNVWPHVFHFPDLDLPKVVAIDTETTPFNPPVYAWSGKTRIAPFGGHDLVLASIAGEGACSIWHRDNLLPELERLLEDSYLLIFFNAAFDVPVLEKAYPHLGRVLRQAVDDQRIRDSQLLEVLIQIADGRRTSTQRKLISLPNLQYTAYKRAGMDISKDSTLRTGFAPFLDSSKPVPARFLHYASQDAVATYRVYQSQLRTAQHLIQITRCPYPVFKDAEKRFGVLSENIQVKGALSLAWLEQFPALTDQAMAITLRTKLEKEATRFEDALCKYDFAHRTKKLDRFRLKQKKLREILEAYAKETSLEVERTATGLLSLEYDFWSKHFPKIGKDLYANPQDAQTLSEKMQIWLRYQRVRKLLSTYVYIYSASPKHYPRYTNIGARTGRTSSSKPNFQNIPKRRDGIRALFVPEKGKVFIEADYDYAELVALAQVYNKMYGSSKLGTAINSGIDPHIDTANRVFGKDPPFNSRQAAKAINFGLPGGLGARHFRGFAQKSYGVTFTKEEAEKIRLDAIDSDPELKRYLRENETQEEYLKRAARNLNISWELFCSALECPLKDGKVSIPRLYRNLRQWLLGAARYPLPISNNCEPGDFDKEFEISLRPTRVLTGRIRGRSTYTSAHNTPFQGLVADGCKLALWNLYKIWCDTPIFEPVAFIHDSILIQCKPSDFDDAKILLIEAMITGMREVCPDIKVTVQIEGPLDRWGKNTNPWGDEE